MKLDLQDCSLSESSRSILVIEVFALTTFYINYHGDVPSLQSTVTQILLVKLQQVQHTQSTPCFLSVSPFSWHPYIL